MMGTSWIAVAVAVVAAVAVAMQLEAAGAAAGGGIKGKEGTPLKHKGGRGKKPHHGWKEP